MRRLILALILTAVLVAIVFARLHYRQPLAELSVSTPVAVAESLRIGFFALKNFGDSKAAHPDQLQFIAARIAEMAVPGLCAVDEVQDSGGSALKALHAAAERIAGAPLEVAEGARVGVGRTEQFALFWNPAVIECLGPVRILQHHQIERDPLLAHFRAAGGFDFTVCVFHLPPSSSDRSDDLVRELSVLDDLFVQVQAMDATENDVIFLGDFNAPPQDQAGTDQSLSISDGAGEYLYDLEFVVANAPTNVLQTKTYDNIFFDPRQTAEFRPGSGQVVRLDLMRDFYTGTVEGNWPKFLQTTFADHCPIYAEFAANLDTD